MGGAVSDDADRVEPAGTWRHENRDYVNGAEINASRRKDNDGKIYVGGLSKETSMEPLKDYFSQFGEVVACTIKMDPRTRRSRGFGFVLFRSAATVDEVLDLKNHQLHGRKIYPKRAEPINKCPLKQIFVDGVRPDIDEDKIWESFSNFGKVQAVHRPWDVRSGEPRHLCFVTFEDKASVWRAMNWMFLLIEDCMGFSGLVAIKTKATNRMDPQHDLRCALSINIKANLEELTPKMKQSQGRH
uniref:heterogeneous nuclear ribonucleoprotein A/B-like n=1 Tax=Myxine glutinosa TaxID=7769 RepID=UPI0035902917